MTLSESLLHWVNDGLMAIFFLVVGLEIKREVLVGELTSVRRATLPIAAALGGAIIPALIFVAVAGAGAGIAARGWGHPDGDRHRVCARGPRTAEQPCAAWAADLRHGAGDR